MDFVDVYLAWWFEQHNEVKKVCQKVFTKNLYLDKYSKRVKKIS